MRRYTAQSHDQAEEQGKRQHRGNDVLVEGNDTEHKQDRNQHFDSRIEPVNDGVPGG